MGFPLFWLLGIPLAQRWGAYRTFRATPAAKGERTYIFSEAEIALETGLSSARLAWPAITRAIETRDQFFLFVSNQAAHFIPKSAFASETDREELRNLLRAKVSVFGG